MSTADLRAVASGQTVQRPQSINDLSHFLGKRMKQISAVIANNLTPEKMARIALNELRNSDFLAKIAIQNPESFVNAIVQAAHLGLEIGGPLGQAYLVPYKGEIKMQTGYRGLISLARRSGEISSINAEIVFERDKFDLTLGVDTKLEHKPYLDGDRGKPKLVYMVARFKDGGHHFEWMSIAEVEKIRAGSSAVQSGKKTPWDTHYEEMVRKTVIRRGWKYLPMSIEMQNAHAIEDANDRGAGITIEGDSTVVVNEPPPAVRETPANVDTDTGEITGGQPDPDDDQLRQVEQKKPSGGFEPSAEEIAAIKKRELAEASQAQAPAARGRRAASSAGLE